MRENAVLAQRNSILTHLRALPDGVSPCLPVDKRRADSREHGRLAGCPETVPDCPARPAARARPCRSLSSKDGAYRARPCADPGGGARRSGAAGPDLPRWSGRTRARLRASLPSGRPCGGRDDHRQTPCARSAARRADRGSGPSGQRNRAVFDGVRLAGDLGEAVAFIDSCANAGWISLDSFADHVRGRSRARRIRFIREALDLADAAARSPWESRLRVSYVTVAGLPRPKRLRCTPECILTHLAPGSFA